MEIFQELFNSIKNFPSESSCFYTYPAYTIQKKMSICRHKTCTNTREILLRNNLVDYLEKKLIIIYDWVRRKKNVVLKLARVALAQIYHILSICK